MSDPNALALATKALQALAGTTTLADITLQASANLTLGSETETGTATLVARGNVESLATLNLTDGQHQEIRKGIAGVWIGTDAIVHDLHSHNCFVDAAWFYPAFSLVAVAQDPTLVATLVGQENLSGEAVYHLFFNRNLPRSKPSTVTLIQRISAMDLYLDAASLLPVELDFNLHPDIDTNVNVPVAIRYGVYQSFNGVQVPTRIQRYLQNSLTLDITVAKAAVNSGVSDSFFNLPAITSGGSQ